MATYSPDSLGIKPPSSGFEEGGFYAGREYVGGTLSEPGELHPNSPRNEPRPQQPLRNNEQTRSSTTNDRRSQRTRNQTTELDTRTPRINQPHQPTPRHNRAKQDRTPRNR